MNAQDILNLVKAGFTHDEIITLAQETAPVPVDTVPAAAPNPAPVPEPDHEPTPAPAQAPAPVPDPVPAAEPNQPDPVRMINELTKQVAQLTSAVQAQAIQNSSIPGGLPKMPDAADTLAEIIRPTRKPKEV